MSNITINGFPATQEQLIAIRALLGVSVAPSPGPAPAPGPTFSAQSAPGGTVGVSYSYQFTASNATSYAVGSGTLPAGLTLSSSGLLNGTPTTAATSSFVVTANGANGPTNSTAQSVTIAAASPAPGVPDTRPRYGVGSATAGVTDPATLLASMAATGSNGSKAATFTVSPAGGQYGWAAFEASASSAGVTFTDPSGPGGWQGASSSGNNFADDGSSPNTSSVTATIGGVTWRFFRQSYSGAATTVTTS